MSRILLQTPELRLGIRSDVGGGVDEFAFASSDGSFVPLWRTAPAAASWFNELSSYTLLPWSNRIAGGAFEFGGTRRELRRDWPDGTAIHGSVKDLPWRILDRSPFSARLGFESADHGTAEKSRCNWPWRFGAVQRYELDGFTLRMDLEITNRSDEPMPAGAGWHPFFPRTLGVGAAKGTQGACDQTPLDEIVVRAPVAGRYPARGMLPTGPAVMDGMCERLARGEHFSDLDLDDVFLLRREGEACFSVEWPSSRVRLDVTGSPDLSHMVVYSGRGEDGKKLPFVCVEPVTMVNDGFNLAARGWSGTGVRTVEPGETWSVWAEWKVRG
jgi:aldose 1-epimerase